MTRLAKAGHRQAMYSAGLILRWIDGTNEAPEYVRKQVREALSGPVEQFDPGRIEECRIMFLGLVDDATIDYFEEVIAFKSLTQTIRITKALYDVLNGLELMKEE